MKKTYNETWYQVESAPLDDPPLIRFAISHNMEKPRKEMAKAVKWAKKEGLNTTFHIVKVVKTTTVRRTIV